MKKGMVITMNLISSVFRVALTELLLSKDSNLSMKSARKSLITSIFTSVLPILSISYTNEWLVSGESLIFISSKFPMSKAE